MPMAHGEKFIQPRLWFHGSWLGGFGLQVLDKFQQFNFVIKQNEQHTNLNISNNTNRYDRQE